MGASAGLMMGASMATQGISSVGNSISQANAISAQGNYQSKMASMNADLAKMQGDDAIARGDKSAAAAGLSAKRTIGAQRAALAASGVDVNSGSAADVQSDTAGISALDQLTIRNNAWRESWGYKTQANNYSGQSDMIRLGAQNASNNTLLTGGLSFLNSGLKAGYAFSKNGSGGGSGITDGYVGGDSPRYSNVT